LAYITTSGPGKKTTTTTQIYFYIRRSLDGGATWSTIEASPTASTKSIGADASSNLYAAGQNSGHWTVRKSINGGATWTPIDDFQQCVTTSTRPLRTQCYSASAQGVASDAFGNLFVAGYSGGFQGVVRASAGGTGPWQTVDTFSYPNGASAEAVVADAIGNVFVAGNGSGVGGSHWLVRKLPAP
jgi:hypothetical protein